MDGGLLKRVVIVICCVAAVTSLDGIVGARSAAAQTIIDEWATVGVPPPPELKAAMG